MTRESEYTIKDGMSTLEKSIKRVFDFIGALIGLILTFPIFIAIIIAQKGKDPYSSCKSVSVVMVKISRSSSSGP